MLRRLLEFGLGAVLATLLLSPVLAAAVMLLTGLALIPLFAPLTTALVLGFFAWMAVRDAHRRRQRNR